MNEAEGTVNIAVLVSGGGTNLQALIDAEAQGELHSGTLALVVSNNPEAYALTRAANAGLETLILTRSGCGGQEAFEEALHEALEKLSSRERRIMDLRFGLSGREELTQKQVAELLGISQSYISRLEKRIICRLKIELENY